MLTIDAGRIPVDRIVDELFSEEGLRKLIGDGGVACFALARAGLSKDFFQQLIQNVDTIDATTREYIAFIVFHGSQLCAISPDYSINKFKKFQVEGISRSFVPRRESWRDRDVLEFDEEFAKKVRAAPHEVPPREIVRPMELATNALLELFNIQERLLPCLLFVEASRLETQIVRIDPRSPAESLYSDILAPLSDEFRALRTHNERCRRLETYDEDLKNAEVIARNFPAKIIKLESDLEDVSRKIAEAKNRSEERIRSLHRDAAAFSEAFRSAGTLEEKIALVPPASPRFAEIHQLSRELSDLEVRKKGILDTPGLSEQDQVNFRELSESTRQLRTRLGKRAAAVRKANERVLHETARKSGDPPPGHLSEAETSLLNKIRKCKKLKAQADEVVRFDFDAEQHKAAVERSIFASHGYGPGVPDLKQASCFNIVRIMVRNGRLGFSGAGWRDSGLAAIEDRLSVDEKANSQIVHDGSMTVSSPEIHTVILCAVSTEYEALQAYFKPEEQLLSKGAIGYKSRLDERGPVVVVLKLQSMGNVSAAVETQHAIDVWRPRFLLLVGIAGGFANADRYLGDLIAADQLIYYELGKLSDKGTARRPQVFRASSMLIAAAQSVASQPYPWISRIKCSRPDGTSGRVNPKVHIGSVLSGDKVVASESFLNEFRDAWQGIVGVEMEGAGAGLAVYRSDTQPEFLMIKAICDWADSSKNDAWQQYAGHVSAAFAISVLQVIRTTSSLMPARESTRQVPQRTQQVGCSGPDRFQICKRLYGNWEEIADYYEISKQDRARFKAGREMTEVWEWLEARDNLDSLPSTLAQLRREDVVRDYPCLTPGGQG